MNAPRLFGFWTSTVLVFALLLAQGCQAPLEAQTADAEKGTAVAPAPQPAASGNGALLWEQNCSRCHYYRRPRARSDSEWRIILHHMRVRANLLAREHREILRFLQAAN